jgi:mono/diheme cytochrome c family protein
MFKLSDITLILLLILALTLTACAGSSASAKELTPPAGDPAAGRLLFTTTCAACHGPAAQGLPGLGKNLIASDFVAGLTDQELVEFIKVGRAAGDPLNTTGVAMPAQGGQAALTEQELYDIAAYIRSAQQRR